MLPRPILIAAAVCLSVVLIYACSNKDPQREPQPGQQSRLLQKSADDSARSIKPRTSRRRSRASLTGTGASTEQPASSTSGTLVVWGYVKLPDGNPPSSATVQLVAADAYQLPDARTPAHFTQTDNTGQYRFTVTSQPNWNLRVVCDGYAIAGKAVVAPQLLQYGLTSREVVRHDFALQPAAFIRGIVQDESGTGLPGITVAAAPVTTSGIAVLAAMQETTTTANGSFEFTTLQPVETSLRVVHPNLVSETYSTTAPREGVLLTALASAGEMSGKVVRLNTAQPLPGAQVILHAVASRESRGAFPVPHTATTNPEGTFFFDRLAAGLYQIDAVSTASGELLRMFPARSIPSEAIRLSARESTGGIYLALYPGHQVAGQVVDATTSRPLENASVLLQMNYGTTMQKVQTDSNGSFVFDRIFGPQDGTPMVRVHKNGFSLPAASRRGDGLRGVDLLSTETEIYHTYRLQPTIRIEGHVLSEDQRPVPGAMVTESAAAAKLREVPLPSAAVDPATGVFSIETGVHRRVVLRASAPGYGHSFSEVIDVADRSVTGVKIFLCPSGSVSGVVSSPGGALVPNAEVVAAVFVSYGNYGHREELVQTTTGPDGLFRVTDVPTDKQVHLAASAPGYTEAAEMINLKPGEEMAGVRLELKGTHYLAGTVRDPEGRPLPAVKLYALNSGWKAATAVTRPDGRYRLEGITGEVVSVQISSEEFGSSNYQNIRTDREDVDFVLKGKRYILRGTVVNAASGDPLTEFEVEHLNGTSPQRTPGSSQFTVSMGDTASTILLKAPGYADLVDKVERVSESADGVIRKTFRMAPGIPVTGRAISASAKGPVPDAVVHLQNETLGWDSAPVASAITDTEGRFRFEKQGHGNVRLVVRREGSRAYVEKRLTIEKGDQVADAGDIELGDGAILRGRVLHQPGSTPVADAGISVSTSDRRVSRTARTNADGRFELLELPSGNLDVTVRAQQFSTGWNRYRVELKAEETREVEFAIGTMELRVRSESGNEFVSGNLTLSGPFGYQAYSFTPLEEGVSFKGLAPGAYTVDAMLISNGKHRSAKKEVQLSGESPVEIIVEFPQ